MFSDGIKFRKINGDPTCRKFKSSQQYLRKLKERKEISEEIYQRIRPQNRRLARAQAYLKYTKNLKIYQNLDQ